MRLIAALFLALLASSPARADTWGCEVLLCMANPAGPMAAAACVPPIKKLWKVLAKGGSWPDCPEANNVQTNTTVTRKPALYGWCPPELTRENPDIAGATVCLASGSIDVVVNGRITNRTWIGITDTATGDLTTYTEENPR